MFGLSPVALLAIACVITGLLGATGTLWYRDSLHELQASDAKAAALAEQHVNEAKAADAKLTNTLAQQAQTIKDTITEQMNATNQALAKVASNPACANDAAANAFDSSLRPAGSTPTPDPKRPATPKPD